MPLPKIDQPLFTVTVPSSGKKVKFRPFTVKEEKILLIAQESKEIEQVVTAIKQILTNCLVGVDVDDLAVFDLEYLMLNIRAKAVNNELKFSIKDPDTEEEVKIEIDVDDIKIQRSENHDNKVYVNDDVVLILKYPNIDFMTALTSEDNDQSMFDAITYCIDSVVDGEDVYKLKEFSKEEVNDFIDGLSSGVIAKIKDFFDTIPAMKYEHKYTDNTGKEKTFVIQGTETFFI